MGSAQSTIVGSGAADESDPDADISSGKPRGLDVPGYFYGDPIGPDRDPNPDWYPEADRDGVFPPPHKWVYHAGHEWISHKREAVAIAKAWRAHKVGAFYDPCKYYLQDKEAWREEMEARAQPYAEHVLATARAAAAAARAENGNGDTGDGDDDDDDDDDNADRPQQPKRPLSSHASQCPSGPSDGSSLSADKSHSIWEDMSPCRPKYHREAASKCSTAAAAAAVSESSETSSTGSDNNHDGEHGQCLPGGEADEDVCSEGASESDTKVEAEYDEGPSVFSVVPLHDGVNKHETVQNWLASSSGPDAPKQSDNGLPLTGEGEATVCGISQPWRDEDYELVQTSSGDASGGTSSDGKSAAADGPMPHDASQRRDNNTSGCSPGRETASQNAGQAVQRGSKWGSLPKRFTESELGRMKTAVHNFARDRKKTQSQVCLLIQEPANDVAARASLFDALVAAACPGRPRKDVVRRAKVLFQPASRSFSANDDAQLKNLVRKLGNKWTQVAHIMNRNPLSVRKRWQNHLVHRGARRTGRWDPAEEARLVDLVVQDLVLIQASRGERLARVSASAEDDLPWTAIAEQMRTRDAAQCKAKWEVLRKQSRNFTSGPNEIAFRPEPTGSSLWRKMSNADKYLIARAIRESGAALHGQIKWHKLVNPEFRKKWGRQAIVLAWERLKRAVPGHETMSVRRIAQYILDGYGENEQLAEAMHLGFSDSESGDNASDREGDDQPGRDTRLGSPRISRSSSSRRDTAEASVDLRVPSSPYTGSPATTPCPSSSKDRSRRQRSPKAREASTSAGASGFRPSRARRALAAPSKRSAAEAVESSSPGAKKRRRVQG